MSIGTELVQVNGIPEEWIHLLERYLNEGGFHISNRKILSAFMIHVNNPGDDVPEDPFIRDKNDIPIEGLPVGQIQPMRDGSEKYKAGYVQCTSPWAFQYHERLSIIFENYARKVGLEIE